MVQFYTVMSSMYSFLHTSGPKVATAGADLSGGTARVCAAEALGTALLVLLSCLPPPGDAPLRALAGGLVVAMLVQVLYLHCTYTFIL